jgi:hypothetical protein
MTWLMAPPQPGQLCWISMVPSTTPPFDTVMEGP